MDLHDAFAAWSSMPPAPATGMSPPLKVRTSSTAAAAETAAEGQHSLDAAAAARASSSGLFSMTADCSAGAALARRAPTTAAPAAAPFCLLPGGGRSPESDATRVSAAAPPSLVLPPAGGYRSNARKRKSDAAPSLAPPPAAPSAPASYDFATVYALLGSLFDPACAGIDHAAALSQMPTGEREVAGVWLRSVAAHLRDPAAMASHAAALTEARIMDSAAAAAAAAAMQRDQQR